MLRAVAILGLTVVVAGVIVAQEQPELTARELFYGVNSSKKAASAAGRKPAQTIKKPATPHPSASESKSHTATTKPDLKYAALGLRYSVLKRSASGQFAEIDASATFQSGDGIRVTIEANDDAYLYIVTKGSSGAWNLLFPSPDINEGDNRLRAHQRLEIPAGGQFLFVDDPGEERLFFVLSRPPETDLDRLISSLSRSDRPADTAMSITDELVGKLRSGVRGRDLIFEKVHDTEVSKEQATYIVNVDGSESSRVVADLSLQHK